MNTHSTPSQATVHGPSSSQAGEKLIRILAFTLILSSMSATMFNIVLSRISEQFELSFSQVSWVSAIYSLIYAIGSVLYGKLADSYRLKDLMTFGLVLFFAGSMVGLAAQEYWMVLLGRILQAAGASAIPAAAMIIPVRYFPAEKRGRALGISATGLALGGALGPVVSALIAGSLHWRWLFCVPLLVLLTLPSYRKYLGDEKGPGGKIDWLGGALLAATVALLLLAVTQSSWPLAGGSLLAFLLFALRIRTAAVPFVQARLFRNKRYSAGLAMAVVIMGTGYTLPFLTPQLLSDVHRLDPGWIGLAMVPAAAVSAMLGRRGGKLADAKGNSYLFHLASFSLLLCFALLSTLAGASAWLVAAILILGNVGQMFMQISLSNAISQTLPKDQAGVGMGLMTLLNFLAGAVSTGVYGRIVDQGAASGWNPLNSTPSANVYSNLYLTIAAVHLVVLLFFRAGFREKRAAVAAADVRS
ncbi:MFS transporter [Cohnella xylanilytica]|uniref:MFS transporter n=1 Tax=Cohnella xylanilytica TaxID=557555 RepID=UPI001B03B9A1|nr:MFS transporter [Cohnella xylanilytica]GIO15754.1 MFS transporter [Cohnella xylanilytica]